MHGYGAIIICLVFGYMHVQCQFATCNILDEAKYF